MAIGYTQDAFEHSAQPLTGESVTVYRWSDPNILSDAPSLVRLPKGRLLCSAALLSRDDSVQQTYGADRCLIFGSDDDGATWHELARLPFQCGRFLLWDERIYFVGSGCDYEGLWVSALSDDGDAWAEPVCLRQGNVYAPAMGYAIRDATLYWAADDRGAGGKGRAVFALAADLTKDLCDPRAWRESRAITHPGVPPQLWNAGHNGGVWLEPNVICFRDTLRVVVRIRISQADGAQVLPNLAAICDLADDGRELSLSFSHYYPFPGAQNHFHIAHDEATDLHWMTCNLVTGVGHECWHGWGNERRFLMLYYGVDGENWFPAGCVARGLETRQAFNYCSPLIDGDDLLIGSRTGHDSLNQHDNDRVTFHRVRQFRRLALDLSPADTRSRSRS